MVGTWFVAKSMAWFWSVWHGLRRQTRTSRTRRTKSKGGTAVHMCVSSFFRSFYDKGSNGRSTRKKAGWQKLFLQQGPLPKVLKKKVCATQHKNGSMANARCSRQARTEDLADPNFPAFGPSPWRWTWISEQHDGKSTLLSRGYGKVFHGTKPMKTKVATAKSDCKLHRGHIPLFLNHDETIKKCL